MLFFYSRLFGSLNRCHGTLTVGLTVSLTVSLTLFHSQTSVFHGTVFYEEYPAGTQLFISFASGRRSFPHRLWIHDNLLEN